VSRSLPAAALVLLLAAPASAQGITTPEAHLGRPVGADFELADWSEVGSYHQRLADESPRVLVETVGRTTEGRDFLLTTISSEANLARLDEIKAATRRLADPRGMQAEERAAVLVRARPIVFVSIGMHSTETAAPQFGMELAHRLATSDEEPYARAREELVVLIAPCLNPDGLDHVVSWYRETVGTPFEASELLRLYQYYAGHDNNRDWFMLSQNETRIVTRLLYSEWFPQVYWDVHQQGRSRERFFVPPFRDPLNPNLDAGIISGIGELGSRAMFDMTREGLSGISSGVTYDMWWNGGNRNVPVRHNVIGLLTEAASVRLATPVFLPIQSLDAPRGLADYVPSNRFPKPWPGGWWRLRDIIEYEHAFARSLLGSVSREPRLWLENALEAAERAIVRGRDDAPRAWLIPSTNRDLAATARLLDALLLAGVELHVAHADFTADGREWPVGTIVIRRDQPYGQHVKDLFEVQRYPEGEPPYDVAGWTLPMLLGVRRVEVMGELDVVARPVATVTEAMEAFRTTLGAPLADGRDGEVWRAAFAHLAEGQPVRFVTDGPDAGAIDLAPAADAEGRVERLPRIGVYSPWRGSKDEGWARFVLDSFDVPFVTVRNEMVRAGELGEFLDVLLIPSVSGGLIERGRAQGTVPPEFTGGLGPEGADAIDRFVRGGGRLVCTESSARWAVELFDLPLADVTRGAEAAGFSCPGSVLRTVPANTTLAAGLPSSLAIFFSRSAAWTVDEKRREENRDERALEVLLRFPRTHVLQSGWIREPEHLSGAAAWVHAAHGDGAVHLFGFRPQYRGWSQQAFQLLFRALLFDA
jgi:hypothetical protein